MTSQLECGYRNDTDRMVILVCQGSDGYALERVVFPFELLTFCCPADTEVFVYSSQAGEPVLRECHPARDLQIPTLDRLAHPLLAASVRDQLDALRQQHQSAPTAETRRQLAIQEHVLQQWLPGSVTKA
jgi:hypothetical protein